MLSLTVLVDFSHDVFVLYDEVEPSSETEDRPTNLGDWVLWFLCNIFSLLLIYCLSEFVLSS